MQGVVFLGSRELEIREFPDPTPEAGEVVIEMKASGMCGSDLHFYRAAEGAKSLGLKFTEPVIAGHEPCGVIVERGPGVSESQAPIGARVMCHHYSGCGTCPDCSSGWSQLCPEGAVVYGVTGNGGHARYMAAPARTMLPLPEGMSFAAGAAISCGTGTAFGALKRMNLVGTDTLVVFGQGPVGLSATMLGRAMGARVIAIDISDERLALASRFGAESTINAGSDDPVSAVLELTRGLGAEKSLECSSAPSARVACLRATKRWGTACYVGEGGDVTIDVSNHMIRKQITLMASWTFSTLGQAECARFVGERELPVDDLFTHQFTLDQAEDAYRLFDTQTTGKGVFLFD